MQELIDYIEKENLERQAWAAKDSDNRFVGMTTTDPEHWTYYGVTTIEQYKHYMLVSEFSDAFKSIHGIRPKWMNFDEMSVEELKTEIDHLYFIHKAQEDETQKEINKLCDAHHCTEDDLKRWCVI